MAVLFEDIHGWIVDQKLWFEQVYRDIDYGFKNDFFEMWEPFMMDSQYAKNCTGMKIEQTPTDTESSKRNHSDKKRKRKMKTATNPNNYHSMVKDRIQQNSDDLLKWGRENYFQPSRKSDNNRLARDAASLNVSSWGKIQDTVYCNSGIKEALSPISLEDADSSEFSNGRVNYNPNNKPMIFHFRDEKFLIPASSKFFMSDIMDCKKLAESVLPANLIIIDPPWENKSIKRIKKYKTLTDWDMYKLPLKSLMSSDGCLVVVWTTNKLKQIKFVKEELFPFWNVKHIADWHWLKVTRSGEMVCDFDSCQKKPYENIIIGVYELEHGSTKCKLSLPDNVEELQNKVIVSIPSSIHSQKPSLSDIFKPFLPNDAVCLELFARNLTPGWISWGNEVLKHQHVDYFEKL